MEKNTIWAIVLSALVLVVFMIAQKEIFVNRKIYFLYFGILELVRGPGVGLVQTPPPQNNENTIYIM